MSASRVERRRRESRRRGGWGVGRWCPRPHWGGVWGGGRAPSQNFFLIFLSESGEFWYILGGASALYVARPTAQESEAEDEGRERAPVKDDIPH